MKGQSRHSSLVSLVIFVVLATARPDYTRGRSVLQPELKMLDFSPAYHSLIRTSIKRDQSQLVPSITVPLIEVARMNTQT